MTHNHSFSFSHNFNVEDYPLVSKSVVAQVWHFIECYYMLHPIIALVMTNKVHRVINDLVSIMTIVDHLALYHCLYNTDNNHSTLQQHYQHGSQLLSLGNKWPLYSNVTTYNECCRMHLSYQSISQQISYSKCAQRLIKQHWYITDSAKVFYLITIDF